MAETSIVHYGLCDRYSVLLQDTTAPLCLDPLPTRLSNIPTERPLPCNVHQGLYTTLMHAGVMKVVSSNY